MVASPGDLTIQAANCTAIDHFPVATHISTTGLLGSGACCCGVGRAYLIAANWQDFLVLRLQKFSPRDDRRWFYTIEEPRFSKNFISKKNRKNEGEKLTQLSPNSFKSIKSAMAASRC